jgi:GAF domain-containing protein
MGVYFDDEIAERQAVSEYDRQMAVDRLQPLRLRGNAKLEQLVEEAAYTYLTAVAAISIVSREDQIFVARTGTTDWGTPRSQSFCAVAIQQTHGSLLVPDAILDPRFASKSNVAMPGGIRFYAGVTLTDAFGHALGALCVVDYRPRHANVDLTILSNLAREVEQICGF